MSRDSLDWYCRHSYSIVPYRYRLTTYPFKSSPRSTPNQKGFTSTNFNRSTTFPRLQFTLVHCLLPAVCSIMILHSAHRNWMPMVVGIATQPPQANPPSPLLTPTRFQEPCSVNAKTYSPRCIYTLPQEAQLEPACSKAYPGTTLPLSPWGALSWNSPTVLSWLIAILRKHHQTAWDLVLTSCLWEAVNKKTT